MMGWFAGVCPGCAAARLVALQAFLLHAIVVRPASASTHVWKATSLVNQRKVAKRVYVLALRPKARAYCMSVFGGEWHWYPQTVSEQKF